MYKHLLNVCKFINNTCENVKMPNIKNPFIFYFISYLFKEEWNNEELLCVKIVKVISVTNVSSKYHSDWVFQNVRKV